METVNILVANSGDSRAVKDCVFDCYKSQGEYGPVAMPDERTEGDGRILVIEVPRAALPLLTDQGIQFEPYD